MDKRNHYCLVSSIQSINFLHFFSPYSICYNMLVLIVCVVSFIFRYFRSSNNIYCFKFLYSKFQTTRKYVILYDDCEPTRSRKNISNKQQFLMWMSILLSEILNALRLVGCILYGITKLPRELCSLKTEDIFRFSFTAQWFTIFFFYLFLLSIYKCILHLYLHNAAINFMHFSLVIVMLLMLFYVIILSFLFVYQFVQLDFCSIPLFYGNAV